MISFPLKVAVIDDEPSIQKEIELLLEPVQGLTFVGACPSVKKALALIEQVDPGLLLLDVELPDGTGFDLLEKIPMPRKVIFLTSHRQYAIRAIKFGALDYLLKPIDAKEFYEALGRVQVSVSPLQVQYQVASLGFRREFPTRLALRFNEFLEIVEVQDIMYCVAEGSYTVFHLDSGKKLLSSKNLKEYQDILPAGQFLRSHHSYLINSDFIQRYHREGYLELKDKTVLPVAVRRRDEVVDYFKNLQ
ncbi:MAG: response regulator transcription factor [Chitinophagaceae bacterium]|nr:MAG: response regulator transcription factor [Chitinophagaceae bacterium]